MDFQVFEDNGGGLTLFVLGGEDDEGREVCLFAQAGFEARPQALSALIKELVTGPELPPDEWEGNEPELVARWDDASCLRVLEELFGKCIADHEGPILMDHMGEAGRREFYPAWSR